MVSILAEIYAAPGLPPRAVQNQQKKVGGPTSGKSFQARRAGLGRGPATNSSAGPGLFLHAHVTRLIVEGKQRRSKCKSPGISATSGPCEHAAWFDRCFLSR